MKTEFSANRLPTWGSSRGQVLLRCAHTQMERINEAGETETFWQCFVLPVADKTVKQTDAQAKELILAQLSVEVNEYINRRYDIGTQASFQALYSLVSTPQEVKYSLLPVWAWIQSVMAYYYAVKAAIRDGEDWDAETWDFSQFDATDPEVSLESFMGE